VEFLRSRKQELMKKHGIFYNEGFFVTVSPEAIDVLVEMATSVADGIYATNISAEFVVTVPQFREVFLKNLPNTDFLFGNGDEFRALGRNLGMSDDTTLRDIARQVANSAKTGNPGRRRTVVVTRGHEPTIVAVGDEEVMEVPVVEVKTENIVDVNGAGDAYVGGFLAALSEKRPILECCRVGAECAAVVIQRSGCTFPEMKDRTGIIPF
jgi:adenosine kinase